MADFIKVVEKSVLSNKISGRTKACILLSELSEDARALVMKKLKLSPKEIHLLNITFRSLSSYDGSRRQCNREIEVLEEALDYGFSKGILPQKSRSSSKTNSNIPSSNEDFINSIKGNPSSIAGLLKDWIDGES